MKSDVIRTVPTAEFPPLLHEIPQPPKQLNARGTLPAPDQPLLSIVGSRKYTSYGRQVVEELVGGLRGTNVGIVSGLALGIDSLAHEAALASGLYTLSIPGGGLDDSVLYPRRHRGLAHRILDAGGGLLSEFAPDFHVTRWSFVQRNRLVAGISSATLLVEAGEKSGTLITARLATDYNRELLVVPGSIFSANSRGVHQFLKLGATPVTTSADIMEVLQIERADAPKTAEKETLTEEERRILALLHEPLQRDELIRRSKLPIEKAAQLLMEMELRGLVAVSDGWYRSG